MVGAWDEYNGRWPENEQGEVQALGEAVGQTNMRAPPPSLFSAVLKGGPSKGEKATKTSGSGKPCARYQTLG